MDDKLQFVFEIKCLSIKIHRSSSSRGLLTNTSAQSCSYGHELSNGGGFDTNPSRRGPKRSARTAHLSYEIDSSLPPEKPEEIFDRQNQKALCFPGPVDRPCDRSYQR